MDIKNKQDWIKDILSKSGTEIKEVPNEGNIFLFVNCHGNKFATLFFWGFIFFL